jgi:hypothetical protein
LTRERAPRVIVYCGNDANVAIGIAKMNMRIYAAALILCSAFPAEAAQDDRMKNENVVLDRVVAVVSSSIARARPCRPAMSWSVSCSSG